MKQLNSTKPLIQLIKQIKTSSLLILLMSISLLADATEFEASLHLNPDQCVAMLQGQDCYVSVELNWQVTTPGDYCLYSSAQDEAVRCWQNSSVGDLKQEFKTNINLIFYLKRQNEQQQLASAKVKMAWVHKKKGKPRTSWRMF